LNMLHSIVNNRMMCDSDKYSIFFTIEQMPVDIQENTIMQLSLDGHSELSEMAVSQSYINCYLADLYRFFKLNSARNEFTDVFEIPLTLGDIPFFRLINPENSFLPQWADMLVNAQQYQAAISALQKEQEVSDDITDTIFRKLGFCYQKLEDWNNAIDAYTKADIINPDQPWTLSKLAFCQRKAMNFDKAAALYAQLDRQNPDQRRYIEPLALCLCQTKRYADAKRLFEKMDYLWPDAKRTTEYKFCQGLVSWVNGQQPNAIRLWGTIPYNDLVSCFMNYSTPISEQDKQFIIDWFRINKTLS
ncbi:MAG: tetratricopeptide repeat protein, partial [Paludibacteraceae bacterium]|nr:tetratricopeptide repeat protein [Paludibacteraceae bacterium]